MARGSWLTGHLRPVSESRAALSWQQGDSPPALSGPRCVETLPLLPLRTSRQPGKSSCGLACSRATGTEGPGVLSSRRGALPSEGTGVLPEGRWALGAGLSSPSSQVFLELKLSPSLPALEKGPHSCLGGTIPREAGGEDPQGRGGDDRPRTGKRAASGGPWHQETPEAGLGLKAAQNLSNRQASLFAASSKLFNPVPRTQGHLNTSEWDCLCSLCVHSDASPRAVPMAQGPGDMCAPPQAAPAPHPLQRREGRLGTSTPTAALPPEGPKYWHLSCGAWGGPKGQGCGWEDSLLQGRGSREAGWKGQGLWPPPAALTSWPTRNCVCPSSLPAHS